MNTDIDELTNTRTAQDVSISATPQAQQHSKPNSGNFSHYGEISPYNWMLHLLRSMVK